VNSVLMY